MNLEQLHAQWGDKTYDRADVFLSNDSNESTVKMV